MLLLGSNQAAPLPFETAISVHRSDVGLKMNSTPRGHQLCNALINLPSTWPVTGKP
jgi:hypothetical protein